MGLTAANKPGCSENQFMKELLLQAKNIELYLISGREPKKAEMGRVGKPGFLSFYHRLFTALGMSLILPEPKYSHA